jgi:hypothetical protein
VTEIVATPGRFAFTRPTLETVAMLVSELLQIAVLDRVSCFVAPTATVVVFGLTLNVCAWRLPARHAKSKNTFIRIGI